MVDAPLSVHRAFAGKTIVLTGSSGFVAKVWLSMALDHLPEIKKIYLILRGNGKRAQARFEAMVNESMLFAPMHERYGEALSAALSSKVEVLEGDLSKPSLGLSAADQALLRRDLDLFVNCAGLVDFKPDVRDTLASNIEGALEVAQFVRSCDHASLLHVSTCYVAGVTEGRIPEAVLSGAPNGQPLDPMQEYRALKAEIQALETRAKHPRNVDRVRREVTRELEEQGLEASEEDVAAETQKRIDKKLKQMLTDLGAERAASFGWPNTYAYSKSLAERLVTAQKDLKVSIFRPAIVEGALTYPFAGWNEGFNTSGPISYLTQTWFRHVPARKDNPLDVIPVDLLCRGMLICAAALLEDCAYPVYHCGTSDENPLTMGRLIELVALAHRKHHMQNGGSTVDRLVLSRWDAVAAHPDHTLRVTNVRKLVQNVAKLADNVPKKAPEPLRTWASGLAEIGTKATKGLRQVEQILELFRPYTFDHYAVFETKNLHLHRVSEPEFEWNVKTLDWRHYWHDVQLPGLRRWSYPLFERRDVEKFTPKHTFKLTTPAPTTAPRPRPLRGGGQVAVLRKEHDA